MGSTANLVVNKIESIKKYLNQQKISISKTMSFFKAESLIYNSTGQRPVMK